MFLTTIGSKVQDQVISLQSRIWRSYENKKLNKNEKLYEGFFIFQPTKRSLVEKLLKSVKTSKAAGSENIPAHMIKDAYKELAYSLCHLINESIKTAIFPRTEKVAKKNSNLQV